MGGGERSLWVIAVAVSEVVLERAAVGRGGFRARCQVHLVHRPIPRSNQTANADRVVHQPLRVSAGSRIGSQQRLLECQAEKTCNKPGGNCNSSTCHPPTQPPLYYPKQETNGYSPQLSLAQRLCLIAAPLVPAFGLSIHGYSFKVVQ